MDSSWIAIYMPLLIGFFIVLPLEQEMRKFAIIKGKKRRGLIIMTNDLIKKYIGKPCNISTGSFGTNAVGIIIGMNENWIEVETKKGNELLNAEFIQSIKITK